MGKIILKSIVLFVDSDDPDYVYVQRRESKPDVLYGGQICFFGGAADENEYHLTCAIREVFEEIRLRVQPNQLTELGLYPRRTNIPGDLQNANIQAYVYEGLHEAHFVAQKFELIDQVDGVRTYRVDEGFAVRIRLRDALELPNVTRVVRRALEDWAIVVADRTMA